ncbi:MAG: hypothetical protein MJZ11_06975 [Lachnospiraceae bacterium]|nr:hypothetical protein [Lachnospiraceae bacterium]
MIPYVDMLHYKTQYKLKGKKNPWEAFFSQPPEFDEKYLDLNPPKILSRYSPPEYEVNNLFTQYDFGLYSEKKKVFDSLFRFSPDITDNLDRIAMDMNISDCIGVYARGTDYNALKPKNHHIQPSASQLIEKCDEYIKEHDLKIFLVTEDNSIYSEFLNYYGDRIVKFDEDIHFDSYSEKVPLHEKIMSYDSIHVAQVYIKKILLLSKCKYLVGGKTSGSLWACIFNDEQYKDVYLFDNGVY